MLLDLDQPVPEGPRIHFTDVNPGDAFMSLFEESKPDDKPPKRPTEKNERVLGLLFLLGPALALIGLIYLTGFLGD